MHEIWPNFFIVGAAKAGTTSMYEYLSRYPGVFFPKIKEPHFFTQVRPTPEQKYFIDAITRRSAYLRLYRKARDSIVVGDASPSYLWHPEVPNRIQRAAPHARILIMLRDPVERAYSHYLMDYREGVQYLPFYEALQEDMNRSEKGWGVSCLYFELGLYAEQVRRYLEAFKPEQVKILLFDDFARDVKGALREVVQFLGMETNAVDQMNTSERFNAYAVPRNPLMRKVAGSKFARMLGRALIPRKVGESIYYKFFIRQAVKPPMDDQARDLLCSLYDPNVTELEKIMGKRLPQLRRSWRGNSNVGRNMALLAPATQ